MAEPTSTPVTTPKRKRGGDALIPPIQFSFSPSQQNPEDGSNSPRSKVAHRFRGLDIAGGGGVAATEPHSEPLLGSPEKRHRHDEDMTDEPEQGIETDSGGVPRAVGIVDSDGKTVPQPDVVDESSQADFNLPEGSLHRTLPSVNRLSESKSRVNKKKRPGTPPLRRRKLGPEPGAHQEADEEMEIVEPVRAALTWREDEITIYDPEDPEDDGTGINGVGFKPTSALAQARVMKRRQQLAEYRKREASDARAKRNQRRRDQEQSSMSSAGAADRKVQFMEDRNVSYGPIPS